MAHLKGITITLIKKAETGKDPFGKPIYKDVPIDVENVLIAPASADDVINELNLSGKKAIYTLAIPKSDTNDWENVEVVFFGKRWKTFGIPLEGLDHLIPLKWNKKVMVERYG